MTDNEDDDMVVIPMPSEDEAERRRIRRSNDHDQQIERLGKSSRHNKGYDQVTDGIVPPRSDRIIDE